MFCHVSYRRLVLLRYRNMKASVQKKMANFTYPWSKNVSIIVSCPHETAHTIEINDCDSNQTFVWVHYLLCSRVGNCVKEHLPPWEQMSESQLKVHAAKSFDLLCAQNFMNQPCGREMCKIRISWFRELVCNIFGEQDIHLLNQGMTTSG